MRRHPPLLLPSIAIAATVLAATTVRAAPASATPTVPVGTGDDLAALVLTSPPGTTFVLAPGVHRDVDVRPRSGQHVIGAAGAVLSGSLPLGAWRGEGGGRWSAVSPVAEPAAGGGMCTGGRPRCDVPVDVYVDGDPLVAVATRAAVVAGTWAFDGGRVVIGIDPAGREVEISRPRSRAFVHDIGVAPAGAVVLENLTIEHYAPAGQECAVAAQDTGGGWWNVADPANGLHGGWLIDGVTVRANHACGIFAGPGTTVRASTIVGNGQIGMKAAGARVSFTGNRIAGNGWAGYDPYWEAGGIKAWNTRDLTVATNTVSANHGPGVWTDYTWAGQRITGNTIAGNDGPGVLVEMTQAAEVSGNRITANAFVQNPDPAWSGGGVLIYASITQVTGNTITGNQGGVSVQAQERGCLDPMDQMHGSCPAGAWHATVAGTNVSGNAMQWTSGFSGLRVIGQSDYPPYAPQPTTWAAGEAAGVRFSANTYAPGASGRGPSFQWPERHAGTDPSSIWSWTDAGVFTFARWQSLGQDVGGRLAAVPAVPLPGGRPVAGLIGPRGPVTVENGVAVPIDAPSLPGAVAVARTASGVGSWIADASGHVATSGDAAAFGDASTLPLNRPINAMAPTPSGGGYWLAASDGGMFAYGDAGFYGSTGSLTLNRPIVGMTPTASGHGYWLVASDGGVFAFGDAGFYGSTGSIALNRPIVGMAATASGHGYWLFATDGGVFAFGDAGFHGSLPGHPTAAASPAIGMVPSGGGGYWIVAEQPDGALRTYGFGPGT